MFNISALMDPANPQDPTAMLTTLLSKSSMSGYENVVMLVCLVILVGLKFMKHLRFNQSECCTVHRERIMRRASRKTMTSDSPVSPFNELDLDTSPTQ